MQFKIGSHSHVNESPFVNERTSSAPLRFVAVLFSEKSNKGVELFAKSCFRWTPDVYVRSGEAVFLEISRCQTIYTEDELLNQIHSLLGVQVRIGIQSSVPGALVSARYGTHAWSQIPVDSIRDWFDPLLNAPADEVRRVEMLIDLLRRLGIANLADFLSIPEGDGTSRFGSVFRTIRARIGNQASLSWTRHQIKEPIVEQLDMDPLDRFESLEPILFFLKMLLDRIFGRLRADYQRMSSARLTLSGGGSSVRSLEFQFPFPQNSPGSVLSIFQERLHNELETSPIDFSIRSLSVEVTEIAPEITHQRHLLGDREDLEEKWEDFNSRAVEKLGLEHVFHAKVTERYLPEKSWIRVLTAKDSVKSVPYPERPLRLFNPPISIARVGRFITAGGQRYTIQKIKQKEKLSGEWWNSDFQRDYFRVETAEGPDLWIYRDLKDSRIYLHGLYE